MARYVPVVAVSNRAACSRRPGPEIPELRRSSHNFEWHEWALIPGYAGKLAWLFTPLLAARVRKLAGQLESKTGRAPFIVAPYPYNARWIRGFDCCHCVYYNLDDYACYEPDKAGSLAKLEGELASRAEAILCLAQSQTIKFRATSTHPERVHHFPLGVMPEFLQENPGHPIQANTVTYIGNLSDRVDWRLVDKVVELCPELVFNFVGIFDTGSAKNRAKAGWRSRMESVFARTNVKTAINVPQALITQWSWRAGANWIPYDICHPFNIACCPTKIMDCLASGRPLLSTAVPECLLYPEWVRIAVDAQDAAQFLKQVFDSHAPYNPRQVEFAGSFSWENRAKTMQSILCSERQITDATSVYTAKGNIKP
jgi:hypothetical protein